MSEILSPRGKRFTWSFSSLSQFDTCPCQYGAMRFYESVKDKESEAMRHGNEVHKALELRLRDKRPLPKAYSDYEVFCRVFEQAAVGRELFLEREVALTRDLGFTGWFASDVWGRGKLDVLLWYPDRKRIYIGDWKTGAKIKNDPFQLQVFSAMASLLYPEAEEFATRFIWLAHNKVTGADFTKADIPGIWQEIFRKTTIVEQAWATEQFPPRESGLCRRHCPVHQCMYNGQGRS